MSDNVNAKKKLEQIEKARQIEKERKERISERKKTKGIDISEGELICSVSLWFHLGIPLTQLSNQLQQLERRMTSI
jgi:hypothetical protein